MRFLADWLHAAGVPCEVVPEQGRLLAERLPPGHQWTHREQLATSLLHRAAVVAAQTVLAASHPAGVVLADGSCATPLIWHLGAVRRRPGYDAGTPEVTEELLAAVADEDYDLVLLVAPDIAWEPDGVRDDPDGREAAFQDYRALLPHAVVVSGTGRRDVAQAHVSALLRLRMPRL